METLFDFLTHVKGVEYIVALLFIAGYLILWEFLKRKPFKTLSNTISDDVGYMRETGIRKNIKTLGNLLASPFILIGYLAMLPFLFLYGIGSKIGRSFASKKEGDES
jgi:hypothetical protein